MNYNLNLQRKITIYLSVIWAVVLSIMWAYIPFRLEQRKASEMQQWMQDEMQSAKNLGISLQTWIESPNLEPGNSPEKTEQGSIQKFARMFVKEDFTRLMIFNGEKLIYSSPVKAGGVSDVTAGMTTNDLLDRQKTGKANHIEEMVGGIVQGGEGTGWFTLDPNIGVEYAAWTSTPIQNSSWTIILSSPLENIMTVRLINVMTSTSINMVSIFTLLSLILLGISLYSWSRDQARLGKLKMVVADQTGELTASQARYRTLVDNLGEGILIVQADTRKVVFNNPAALKLQGSENETDICLAFLEDLITECIAEGPVDNKALENLGLKSTRVQTINFMNEPVFLQVICSRIIFDAAPAIMFVMEDITARSKAEDALHRRASEFAALYTMSKKMATQNEEASMLVDLLEYTMAMLDISCGEVYLYDPVEKQLELKLIKGLDLEVGTRLGLGEGAVGGAGLTQHPVIVGDYKNWPNRIDQNDHVDVGSIVAVPMVFGGDLIGVMAVFTIGDNQRRFSDADSRLLALFASQAAAALRNARLLSETRSLYDKTELQLKRISALFDINTVINTNLDLRLTLKMLLEQVISQLNVDAADILLYHNKTRTLEFAAGARFQTSGIEQLELNFNEDIAGRVILEGKIITISDTTVPSDTFVRGKFMAMSGFVTYVGAPLISKGEAIGVLEIFNRSGLDSDAEWFEFLKTLAGQAAVAINNASLFEGLQRKNREMAHAYEATIEGWVRTLDMRDHETEGHSQRVANFTVKMALKMGIRDEALVEVRRGALLHDIGKIGIPDNILLKPGPLTDEEWVTMRTHPRLAYEMMSSIPFLVPSADIPYCHHEKWDGSGYPRKLAGEQIPLTARIFAVVDVWDALTSDRPYRKAWDEQKAMDHIKEQKGKHFDPQVIDQFLHLIGDE